MNKEEFQRELRAKLREVPRDTRKKWNETDLFIWWDNTNKADSYLTWDRCPGNVWQWVPGFCKDLIGESAIS